MAVADKAATDSDPELDLDAGLEAVRSSGMDSGEAGELDEHLPNAERLVGEAVALAGPDHLTAALVGRFWRFAPDEELVGFTPEEMYAAARSPP